MAWRHTWASSYGWWRFHAICFSSRCTSIHATYCNSKKNFFKIFEMLLKTLKSIGVRRHSAKISIPKNKLTNRTDFFTTVLIFNDFSLICTCSHWFFAILVLFGLIFYFSLSSFTHNKLMQTKFTSFWMFQWIMIANRFDFRFFSWIFWEICLLQSTVVKFFSKQRS